MTVRARLAGMASDPNWLLATVATCTAALVAIVGALLVSRVISLSSDQASLQRRSDELGSQVTALTEQLEDVSAELLRRDAVDFVHEAADDIIKGRGEVDLGVLMERHDPRDRAADELRPTVEEAAAAVAAAFRQGDPRLVLDLSADRYRLLYARLVEVLAAEGRDGGAVAADRPAATSGVVAGQFTLKQEEAYRQLLRERQSLRSTRRTLQLQRKEIDAALGGLSNPPGLWAGLAVLVVFAVVGAVVPLVIMSTRPATLGRVTAGLVIGLFLGGLVMLASYVAVEIRRLARRSGRVAKRPPKQ